MSADLIAKDRRASIAGIMRNSKPTVLLVHGGFVDGSGWKPVHDILTRDGFNVAVVQNPHVVARR